LLSGYGQRFATSGWQLAVGSLRLAVSGERLAASGLRSAVCSLRPAVCGQRFAVNALSRSTLCGQWFAVCVQQCTESGLAGGGQRVAASGGHSIALCRWFAGLRTAVSGWFAVNALRSTVRGLRSTLCGQRSCALRSTGSGSRFAVSGQRTAVGGLRFVVCGLRPKVGGQCLHCTLQTFVAREQSQSPYFRNGMGWACLHPRERGFAWQRWGGGARSSGCGTGRSLHLPNSPLSPVDCRNRLRTRTPWQGARQ
jgi:hypothetical protein